jgi:hypothetical protein
VPSCRKTLLRRCPALVGAAFCVPTRIGQTILSIKDAPGSFVLPLRRH